MERLPFTPTLWILPPLVSFLTLLALSGLSMVKGKGRKLSLLFSGICLLGALLSLEKVVISAATDPHLALQSSRWDHLVVVFFIPLYLHFTITFLHLPGKRRLIFCAYGFSVILSLFTQSSYYIVGVFTYGFGYYPKGGPLLFVFGAASTVNTGYCLYLLIQGFRRERDPFRKNKYKYIMMGLGGAAMMAHLNFLPLMGISCYPLGNLAFIPLLILGFAVLKHDLLDMGLAFQKGLLYSTLTGLLTGGYGIAIILFDQVFKDVGPPWADLFPLILFILIVFVFDPVKRRIQAVVDRLLFRGKYDYQKTLRELSGNMASMLNLREIMERTLRTLIETMHLEWGYVMLRNDNGRQLRRRYRMGPIPPATLPDLAVKSPLIEELTSRQREATQQAVEKWSEIGGAPSTVKDDFLRLSGTVVIPLIFREHVNGLIVLGNKKSGDLFTPRDLELLRTLANQCAISVENAMAYQVIEKLNITLEHRVEQRTAELKEALEQKEKAQELLIRSESLAALGALVAGVAHELNNPMASVYSLVQSSVDTMGMETFFEDTGTEAEEDRREVVEDLVFCLKELVRMKDIVASLLGLSRQTQEYSEPVCINDVAGDALKILSNQYKRTGITVSKAFSDPLPDVTGNFANLGQVCLNIITNAIQAVDRKTGKIILRTWYDTVAKMVVFECEDNGPGISDDNVLDIFKPFFTTKAVGKGTGLGLYVSHEIIRRHGGFIQTKKGGKERGAVFQVALPVNGDATLP